MMAPTTSGTGIESLAGSVLVFELSPANGHLRDKKRRSGGRAAKFQIRSDGFHPHQHIIQISGDCDFGDRKRQFSIMDPKARSAA
jgi:hypothetical protein